MENTQLKDLEVLSRYLSEEELKEVASQVARETFRNSMGIGNPHSKANIDYYASQGAYLAVKEYAEENDEIDFKEMSKALNSKVNALIKGLQTYQLNYDHIIKEAVESRADDFKRKVDSIITQFLEDEESYSGVYKQVERDLGYILAEHLMTHLKESFTKEDK